jgi:hypothetical protein
MPIGQKEVTTIPVSIEEAISAIIVIFFSCVIQGRFGMGGALLAAPLLLLINPIFVPVPILVSNIILTALVSRADWQSINFHDLGYLFIGRLTGTFPGVAVLAMVSGLAFDFLFGVLILIAVGLSLVGRKLAVNRISLALAGFASGFMGTISSIGGPPVALLYQHQDSTQFRATLSMQLLLGGTVSVIAIALGTDFGTDDILVSLMLVPGSILGFYASRLGIGNVTQSSIRIVTLTMSVLGSVVVLVRATLSLLSGS